MKLNLICNNEQQILPISDEFITLLENLLRIAGETEGVAEGDVEVTFVDNETIQKLNRDYRGLDKPTDVLSFSMNESTEDELKINYNWSDNEQVEDIPMSHGDIFISVERAIEQSKQYEHSITREIGFLFVHGFLHLLGFDHQDETSEREMFSKQETILNKAGLMR